jgi:hypothetical protein
MWGAPSKLTARRYEKLIRARGVGTGGPMLDPRFRDAEDVGLARGKDAGRRRVRPA